MIEKHTRKKKSKIIKTLIGCISIIIIIMIITNYNSSKRIYVTYTHNSFDNDTSKIEIKVKNDRSESADIVQLYITSNDILYTDSNTNIPISYKWIEDSIVTGLVCNIQREYPTTFNGFLKFNEKSFDYRFTTNIRERVMPGDSIQLFIKVPTKINIDTISEKNLIPRNYVDSSKKYFLLDKFFNDHGKYRVSFSYGHDIFFEYPYN